MRPFFQNPVLAEICSTAVELSYIPSMGLRITTYYSQAQAGQAGRQTTWTGKEEASDLINKMDYKT